MHFPKDRSNWVRGVGSQTMTTYGVRREIREYPKTRTMTRDFLLRMAQDHYGQDFIMDVVEQKEVYKLYAIKDAKREL